MVCMFVLLIGYFGGQYIAGNFASPDANILLAGHGNAVQAGGGLRNYLVSQLTVSQPLDSARSIAYQRYVADKLAGNVG